MKIPKKVIRKNREYVFKEICNNNLFSYEDVETKTRTSFTKFDLGLINNEKIDKMLDIKKASGIKLIVYDRLLEKETEYSSMGDASRSLGVHESTIARKINNKEWLKNRWFIERVEE